MINYFSGLIKAKLDKKIKVLANNISFSLEERETLALVGETGSGKTIVACSIMKLLPDNVYTENLKFEMDGNEISKLKSMKGILGKTIVYIPQSGLECLNQSLKIGNQINDSLKLNKIPKNCWENRKQEILKSVGFDNPNEIMNKYPFELSGGMGQRVVIALASISNPKLIIADEPTNGLDKESKFEVMKLLKDLFPTTSILLITHDIDMAKLSSRCIVLNKGIVVEEGRSEDILISPHHPYTKSLLNAQVDNGMKESPLLRNIVSFCPFASRCNKFDGACEKELIIKENGSSKWRCNHD